MGPVLKRLLGYYRPYAGQLLVATVLMALAASIPALLVLLIERVLDDVLIAKDGAALAAMPVAIMVLYAANGSLHVGRTYMTRRIAFQVVTRLRRELFAHTLGLDVGWHQRTPLGAQLTRLTSDLGNVQYLVSAYATLVQRPLTLLGLLAAALWQDWRLTLAAVVLLPLVALPISRFGRQLRRTARESLDNLASLTTSAQETLSGIRVVQAFRAEPQRLKRFEHDNDAQLKLQLDATLAQLLPGPIIELIAAVGVGLAIAYGGQRVFAGELEPGQLIAFLVAVGLMNLPLKQLSEINSLTQRAIAGAEAAFRVLDTAPSVQSGSVRLDARTCELQFEGLGFDYGDGPVLSGIDITVSPGERVALVGPSGAGKSTLIGLVPRFHDPSAGRVLLNGRDLRELDLGTLRRHVAMVSQDSFLFNASVLDNVRLGRPEARREEVEVACRDANAHGFVSELPQGYDTLVDEGGLRLSGGQRQRICIARALLCDAPVLLLDEATSALDRESEEAVQEALGRLMDGRTVIAIAHRLSTVKDADRIVVLEGGRVVQMGRHDDLVSRPGEYARLYGEGA